MDSVVLLAVILGLGACALAYVAATLRRPGQGWLGYAIVLALLPLYFNLIPDSESGERHDYILAFVPVMGVATATFLIWAAKTITLKSGGVRKGPLFIPLFSFLVACLLSLISAANISAGLVMAGAWAFTIFLYLAVYNTIEDRETIKRIVLWYIGATACLAVVGMIKAGTGAATGANAFASDTGSFLEKNHLAFIMEESLFLSFLVGYSRSFTRNIRIYSLGCFVILLAGMVFSLSRGGWIGCAGGLIVMMVTIRGMRNFRGKVILGVALVVTVALFAATDIEFVNNRFMSMESEQNFPRRIPMLMAGVGAFWDHPITGVGIRNFQEHFWEYVPWTDARYFDRSMGVNNLYIRILAETGLVGFVAMAWIFWVITKEVLSKMRAVPEHSQDRILLVGFLAGFVANLIHFNFLDLIYPIPWIFFFFGIAITKFIVPARQLLPAGAGTQSARSEVGS